MTGRAGTPAGASSETRAILTGLIHRPRENMPVPALFALLILAAAPAADGADPASAATALSPEVSVRRLTGRVWVHTTRHRLADGRSIPSNGLIVDTGDNAVLVDTAWGVAETRAVPDWAERTLGRAVTRAVLTHGHEDRIGGLPALRERGIALVYAAAPTLGDQSMPDDVLLKDAGAQIAVADGVVAFYPGAAHAPDNLMIWVEPDDVLFGGCAVRAEAATGLGNTADADLASWRRAIHYVLTRYPEPRWVVPGHGEPGGADLLVLTRGHVARAEEAAAANP